LAFSESPVPGREKGLEPQNRGCPCHPPHPAVLRLIPINKLIVALACFHRIFVFFFETRSHYVAQAGLELTIFLPPLPKGWDYRHAPLPHLVAEFMFISISSN
jgi:hypothetical protein